METMMNSTSVSEVSFNEVLNANKVIHVDLNAAAPYINALGFISFPITDTDEIEAWKKLGPLAKTARGQGFQVVVGKPYPSLTKPLLLLTDQSHPQQHGQ
jgi:hypothetical protein